MAEGKFFKKPEKQKTTGIYIGRRIQKGNKLFHTFIYPDNRLGEFWYPRAKPYYFNGAVIGKTYTFESRFPIMWHESEASEDRDPDAEKWEILDKIHATEHKARQQKSSPWVDGIVNQLQEHRRNLHPSKRGFFDAWLLNEIRKG